MAAETDTTIPHKLAVDFVRIADELYALQRGLAGLSLAVDGLGDRRASHALGHLVHLVECEAERLSAYVEEIRPQPARG